MVLWTLHAAQNLRLKHSPGTIASALAMGVPAICELLMDGNRTEEEMREALRGLLVSLNPRSLQIEIAEGTGGMGTKAGAAGVLGR